MTTPRPTDALNTGDWLDEDIKAVAMSDRQQSVDLLVRKYGERLYVHAYCILKDAQEARDVVQEVFIKAMREPRFFDGEFKMQAWLYRVTRNLCFNLVRDRRRRDGILATVPRSEEFHADPIEVVFGGERQDEIIQAIGQLTEDHRTILLLRYYEDMSYAEIARALSIKLGTVMSRLSRARDRLLSVLGEDPELLAAS
ncbi:MAG: RNA polymerase sigma factor [Pseudomonadota bacterium]|nr:RNA polymerase sigma factor [Pseudomonadota bacterium]